MFPYWIMLSDKSNFIEGRMNMKRKNICVLFAAILLVVLIAAGCGREQKETGGKEASGSDIEVVVGCEATDFVSFDVRSQDDGAGFTCHSALVYETLVSYNRGKIMPCLAETWEVNGKEYVFHLRKGVKFTDGSEFNAAAVKLNLEMFKKHYGEQLEWFGAIAQLAAVEVVDEYTVKLVYKQPYYAALQDFAYPWTGMMSPKAFENGHIPYGRTFTASYGTGPYKLAFDNSEKGRYYTFIRNEDYWGEKPRAKKYIVKIIPALDARMMALRTGEVDFVLGTHLVSYDAVAQLRSDQGFGVKLSEERTRTRNILLNTARGPLMDVKVRRAIEHGTNKIAITENILYGLEVKADYLLNPQLPYCDVTPTPYEYNREKAEALLEEAGWKKVSGNKIREKDGKPLVLKMIYRSGYGSEEDIVQAFQGQLLEIGIDVKATNYEMMTWYRKGMTGAFDITVNNTYGLPFDPHAYISPMRNDGLDNPAQQGLAMKKVIDEKIVKLFETMDASEIQDIYSYLLSTLHEEAVYVPVSYMREVVIFNRNKIEDIDFNGLPNFVDIGKIKFK